MRMALGSTRGGIARLFMRRALVPSAFGLVVGIVAAAGLTQLLRSQLYGVTPGDPRVYLASVVVLLVPVVLATLRPAWIAASVDPAQALRSE